MPVRRHEPVMLSQSRSVEEEVETVQTSQETQTVTESGGRFCRENNKAAPEGAKPTGFVVFGARSRVPRAVFSYGAY